MERMSLREASGRTSLSITTLRRYIRSGRLRAEKRAGRYGPEYFVSADDLEQAGVEALVPPAATTDLVHAATSATLPAPHEQALRETVPVSLFRELQMKHEQMLVQYGMMRAGGLRTIELQAEIDVRRRQTENSHAEVARLKDRLARESSEFGRKVREIELEAEGLRVENAALREKARALELLTRNAVTTETIDRKYEEVMDQIRRVDRLVALHDVGTLPTPDH